MKSKTKSLLCSMMAGLLLWQTGGGALATGADDAAPRAVPEDGSTLSIVLAAPVYETDEDGKETLKLDGDGRPVFEEVQDPDARFGSDSGLCVLLDSKPEKDGAEAGTQESVDSATVAELREKAQIEYRDA